MILSPGLVSTKSARPRRCIEFLGQERTRRIIHAGSGFLQQFHRIGQSDANDGPIDEPTRFALDDTHGRILTGLEGITAFCVAFSANTV